MRSEMKQQTKQVLDHIRAVTGNYLSGIFARAFTVSAHEMMDMDTERVGIAKERIGEFLREMIPLQDEDGEPVQVDSVAEHLVRALATSVSAWFADETMNPLLATRFQLHHKMNLEDGREKKVRYTTFVGNATVEAVGGEDIRFAEHVKELDDFEEFEARIREDYTGYTLVIRLPVFATMNEVRPTDELAKARQKLILNPGKS